jgi:hypothetical protein
MIEHVGKDFCDKCNGDTIGIVRGEYHDGAFYFIDIQVVSDKNSSNPCRCKDRQDGDTKEAT